MEIGNIERATRITVHNAIKETGGGTIGVEAARVTIEQHAPDNHLAIG